MSEGMSDLLSDAYMYGRYNLSTVHIYDVQLQTLNPAIQIFQSNACCTWLTLSSDEVLSVSIGDGGSTNLLMVYYTVALAIVEWNLTDGLMQLHFDHVDGHQTRSK